MRQIDVGTLWVSLKEAEFSSRSRFCERRRLPIECRGVPSISTQNIDQNNCQQRLQNFHVFHRNTEKAKVVYPLGLFPVLSRNHYFYCIWSKKTISMCSLLVTQQWWCVRAHQVFGPRRALAGREVFSRRDFRHKFNKFDSLAYATTFTTKTNLIPTFSLRVTFDIKIHCIGCSSLVRFTNLLLLVEPD